MDRTSVSTGGPWEAAFGYSRAVRAGAVICVSGCTAARRDGTVAHPGDAHGQALVAFEVIGAALRSLGADLADVVRTRMFVTDMAHADAVGRAHGEVFGAIRPAATMVEVRRLIHPEMLVEIEADAIAGSRSTGGRPPGPPPA